MRKEFDMKIKADVTRIIDELTPCFDETEAFFHAARREYPKYSIPIDGLSDKAKCLWHCHEKAEGKFNTAADVINVNRYDLHKIVTTARRWYNKTKWEKCLPDIDAVRLWNYFCKSNQIESERAKCFERKKSAYKENRTERELEIKPSENTGFVRAYFNSTNPQGQIRRIGRNITPPEVDKAIELIESGNEYQIDAFCYSIV